MKKIHMTKKFHVKIILLGIHFGIGVKSENIVLS